ncbi:50S ribosomal protein L29 [Candidatus Woesebacteria bacterium RIFOXYA1_FULL_43_9]|uniref:Large ribosomal subunit protein uL29 n=1 Tax=Candidatus Woesebacteria bacterium RIFOXYA1_FULL_43_9 TaxID=1802534 RepID=A0A1F8CNC7_9BACT|nr:MAG: 50S ribosomal protein L29 [Candidatus Woesebacteria bacterium RIFOXYA1_FULL_43_9]
MKTKKVDYKTKETAELKAGAKKLQVETWKMKAGAVVGKIKDTSAIAKNRKNIARILGIISERSNL